MGSGETQIKVGTNGTGNALFNENLFYYKAAEKSKGFRRFQKDK